MFSIGNLPVGIGNPGNRCAGVGVDSSCELQLVGVEDDGEGAVVDEFHLHVGSKAACRDVRHIGSGETEKYS